MGGQIFVIVDLKWVARFLLPTQYLGMDLIALIFLAALLTVSHAKGTANKLIHQPSNGGAAD